MEVIVLLVFISLVLVAGAVLFLMARIHGGDFEHGERLALLPLEPDEVLARTEGEEPDGQ